MNRVWRNVAYDCRAFLARDGGIEKTMGNLAAARDQGLVDPDHLNLALKANSCVAAQSGFRAIPFGEIGLYMHAFRASWPVANPVGAIMGSGPPADTAAYGRRDFAPVP